MSKSPSGKRYVQMRATPDFKARFDAAAEFKGWKMQTALERILGEWVERTEREMRTQGKQLPPLKPYLEK